MEDIDAAVGVSPTIEDAASGLMVDGVQISPQLWNILQGRGIDSLAKLTEKTDDELASYFGLHRSGFESLQKQLRKAIDTYTARIQEKN